MWDVDITNTWLWMFQNLQNQITSTSLLLNNVWMSEIQHIIHNYKLSHVLPGYEKSFSMYAVRSSM